MYNATTIKTGLIDLIGWRQNDNANGWQLTDLLASVSGLYYNDEHPLLTIENLVSVAPEFDRINADQLGVNEDFTAWLKQRTESGIIRTVTDWFNLKFDARTASNLLERGDLFTSAGSEVQQSTGKTVGFEIVSIRSKGLIVNIESISLNLSAAQILTVELYESGKTSPIQSISCNYVVANEEQYFVTNWQLSGQKTYWVVYNQSDLTGSANNTIYNFTYTDKGFRTFPSGKFYDCTAFQVDEINGSLWGLNENNYTLDTNFGLNMSVNVQCDYTSFIIEQRDLFKTAISKRVTMDLLRELAYNPNVRINRNEANVNRQEILYEIDGDSQGRAGGLRLEYEKALNSIKFDRTGIDKICLPCSKKGVKYGVI